MVQQLGAPRLRILAALLGAGMMFSTGSVQAAALHAFCYSTSTCSDNGTNTPVTQKEPDFGFAAKGGGLTGDFVLDILIPSNDFANSAAAQAATYTIMGTQGGSSNDQTIDKTATLFSTTAWTSGQLDSYLGLTHGAQPTNPIGAYLPSTQTYDPSATGFYVYQVNLGTTHLCGVNDVSCEPNVPLGNTDLGPQLTISSPGLQIGSYIVGFLNVGTTTPKWYATANSGALFDTPEPGSLLLVFGGLLGFGMLRRRVSTQTI